MSGGVTFIALSHNGTSEETARIIQNRNFVNALSAAIDRQALVDAMFPTNSPFTGVINPRSPMNWAASGKIISNMM